ncbi:MAG TPA: chromosomal replication initiator protein DnaA [Rhizomicrobium sp.]
MSRDTTKLSTPDWPAIWTKARERLRRELGDAVYDVWLSQLVLLGCEKSELKIAAPRMFVRNWVANHYVSRIERACRAEGAEPAAVSIVLAPPTVGGGLMPTGSAMPSASISHLPVMPRIADRPAESRSGLSRRLPDPTQTFENFVPGSANDFALGAARAFAQGETPAISLLYIHGTFGVGKTHLLNAIALGAQAKGRRALLLSSEEFMRRFLGALKSKESLEFKDEIRAADMLLVDDLQHLCRSTYTMSEFLHTLNAFSDLRRKFVIAADRAPIALEGLSAEVRSRLSGGVVISVEKPDRATRLAILKARADRHGRERGHTPIPDTALERMAEIEGATPRDLIGLFSKLELYADLTKNPVSFDVAVETILRSGAGGRKVSIEDIQRKAAEFYKLDLRDFVSKQRSRRVARPRQIAMYLSRQLTERSLPEIGRRFGNRDHTTVLHACRTIQALCELDPVFKQEVEFLKDVLNKPL